MSYQLKQSFHLIKMGNHLDEMKSFLALIVVTHVVVVVQLHQFHSIVKLRF